MFTFLNGRQHAPCSDQTLAAAAREFDARLRSTNKIKKSLRKDLNTFQISSRFTFNSAINVNLLHKIYGRVLRFSLSCIDYTFFRCFSSLFAQLTDIEVIIVDILCYRREWITKTQERRWVEIQRWHTHTHTLMCREWPPSQIWS